MCGLVTFGLFVVFFKKFSNLSEVSSRDNTERGQAATELAIILPVLTMVFMSLFDLGMAVNQYLSLTHVTYESARFGASHAGLRQALIAADGDTQAIKNSNIIEEVSNRAYILANKNKIPIGLVKYQEHSESNEDEQMFSVTTTSEYESFFPLFGTIELSVEASAPYLYRE